jgi:hypothetical protein
MFNILSHKGNANQNDAQPSQNVYHQENKQHMLVRMWRAGETLTHCWWECKLVQTLWESALMFLRKLKIELSSHPATHS